MNEQSFSQTHTHTLYINVYKHNTDTPKLILIGHCEYRFSVGFVDANIVEEKRKK